MNTSLGAPCLGPFIPLRRLMEVVEGEAVLEDLRPYRDVPWIPQQVGAERERPLRTCL